MRPGIASARRPDCHGAAHARLVLARLWLLAAALVAALVAVAGCSRRRAPSGRGERRLTIFYTAEVHGTLEPCGCTSDPLGDVARYADAGARRPRKQGAVAAGRRRAGCRSPRAQRQGEAGDRRAARGVPGESWPSWARSRPGWPRPTSARGRGRRRAARGWRCNLAAVARRVGALAAEDLGGVRVGDVGRRRSGAGGAARRARREDPVAAGKREATRLRQAGAELVVALAPVDKPSARRLAREAARRSRRARAQVGTGRRAPSRSGNAFLVAAADELQRVGRIDIVWRGTGRAHRRRRARGDALRRVEIDAGRRRASTTSSRRWTTREERRRSRRSSPAKRARARRAARRARRLDAPWTPPATGSYFTNRLDPAAPQPAARSRRSPRRCAARRADRAPSTCAQRAAAAPRAGPRLLTSATPSAWAATRRRWRSGRRPCTPTRGRRWSTAASRTTTSASAATSPATARSAAPAWATPTSLRDVQCEVCHGPGSIHVAEKGLEEPPAVHKQTPASTCTACHTEQHSDTFQYEAYLRDILGRATARARARSWATARPGTSCAPRRSRARRPRARRRSRRLLTTQRVDDSYGNDGAPVQQLVEAGRARCCRR